MGSRTVRLATDLGYRATPSHPRNAGGGGARVGPIVQPVCMNRSRPLRVALINTADSAGGAESVARMVRDGLRLRGHRTDLWVGRRRRRADDPGHTHQIPSTTAQHQAAKRYAQHGFFSLGVASSDVFCNSGALSSIDLIHLHNLHGHYFSITALPQLAEQSLSVLACTGVCCAAMSRINTPA